MRRAAGAHRGAERHHADQPLPVLGGVRRRVLRAAPVLRAATERLVPIMMTVLTTGFALIPLLVAGSIPGQEIEHPMAVVFFGGLVTATLLNLFVVPSLYLRFAKSRRPQLQVT
jgi:Cu/Ag efflux pump CusA